MDEARQGVATNGARAEPRSEQGWGKDPRYPFRLTTEELSAVLDAVEKLKQINPRAMYLIRSGVNAP